MSEQPVIDSLEFARHGRVLRGTIPVSALARLADTLGAQQTSVDYELVGRIDEAGKPIIRLALSGCLTLVCQRCLQPLDYTLDAVNELELVANEAELDEGGDEDDAPDRIVADKAMDVMEWVEEELLLSLPMAPRHAEGECPVRLVAEAREAGPFAALAALKKT